ncbi:alpha/beta hydrolase-fold protein [Flavobacteriaceae sp. LMIT009]
MKRVFFTFVAYFLLLNSYSQGKVLKSQSMASNLLNTDVKYSVYLPPNFESSDKSYPVVYLLNGFTGDETDWTRVGLVQATTDELIRGKKITPMVIIMPDGDDRLYMNKADRSYPYEDMIIKELMPYVEEKYRIKSEKKYRSTSGLSMGGAGSLRLALKHHELFGACAAFSSAIVTDAEIKQIPQGNFDNYFARIDPELVGKEGEDRLTDSYNDSSILHLINNKDPELLKTVNIYFDCGDDDFLAIGNSQLHIDLLKKSIPHEYRVRDGGHTWNFWVDSLPEGLIFISNSMRD